jgi:cytochrome d ubiquinol oxidase subunit I
LDDEGEIKYEIRIPYALSILAGSTPTTEVIGLDQFPEEETPTLIIHYFFDIMVTIGMFMVLLSLVYWFGIKRGWSFVRAKWYRWLIVLGGPLSFVAIESGWWMAELGRQPWILRGIMTIEAAATSSDYVGLMTIFFGILYLILGIGTVVVLHRMFKNNPVELELEPREPKQGGEIA